MANKIETLAAEMGVSVGDLADFLAGLRLQMARGLDLDEAIRAHRDMWNAALDHVYRRAEWSSDYRAGMRGFVVDTFFPEDAR